MALAAPPEKLPAVSIEAFPRSVTLEGIPVAAFSGPEALFDRILHEVRQPGTAVIHYLNVHVANTAFHNRALRQALQAADLVYCDGAGIVLGSRLMGDPLPTRMTAGDWFIGFLERMARDRRTIYLLGGEPGIPEAAMAVFARAVPDHTVVGMHHGYIINAPETEQRVFNEIARLAPDVLIVGFGTPLQEEWVARHRHQLRASVILPLGAVMDYFAGRLPRCPRWMGRAGLEWLFRFIVEPRRLMGRYLVGNPWYLLRMGVQAALHRASGLKQGMFRRPLTASRHYFL